MSPDLAFFSCLGTTLLVLGLVVVTGLRAKRGVHLVLVATAVVLLVATIYFAEQLGDDYDLESAGWITPFHLTLAKITTACYLLPVVTGIRTLRDPGRRRAHRWAAFTVLALSVATFATGLWMLLASERLP